MEASQCARGSGRKRATCGLSLSASVFRIFTKRLCWLTLDTKPSLFLVQQLVKLIHESRKARGVLLNGNLLTQALPLLFFRFHCRDRELG
jgi:hypothetical protein